MHPWHDVELGTKIPQSVPAIIEIPSGSKMHYVMDKKTGLLKLSEMLFSAAHYPMNFGFLPQTVGNDDDPLDVFVINQTPIIPLTIVEVRILGGFIINSKRKKDEYRLIAANIHDPMCQNIKSLKDVPSALIHELKQFFSFYQILNKEHVTIGKTFHSVEATKVIKKSHDLYEQLYAAK